MLVSLFNITLQSHKERPVLKLQDRTNNNFLLNNLLNTLNVGDHVNVRMVTLLRIIDILKMLKIIEIMIAFEKFNKCLNYVSDILKALFK